MTTSTTSKPQSGTTDWQEHAPFRGRVLHREKLADHVHLYVVEKPDGYKFQPGQATELSIDEVGWRDKKRPFTFTSLPSNPRLEFIIKSYPTSQFPKHEGMTEHLGRDIHVGDRVLFGQPWGAIRYRGPGVFLAGGAGITPFISILRQLEQQQALAGHRLFFSNRTRSDVFLQGELFRCLGHNVVCTLTNENHPDYEHGRIDRTWLESRVRNFNQFFYLCGPSAMVDQLQETLETCGAQPESIVREQS